MISPTDERVAAVRAFNRFYTKVIGALREGLLRSPYSLTEARVLFELARAEDTEVAALRRELGIDAAHLSRILTRFESAGLVVRGRAATDARRQVARLTAEGRTAFAGLDESSEREVRALLATLTEDDQRRLVASMAAIERTLGAPVRPELVVLRSPAPGDYGWVVQRHGALYASEFGWDATFEALVARIVADYAGAHDPARERAWIAEIDGEPAGCVFCVRREETVAQLRLLLVEPAARGLGIGARLVDECLRFARSAGYGEIVLWTNDVLVSARRIYERAGFELVEEGPHASFGKDLVEQTWRLSL
jgi:DNA-binding MarR family transcriptional regulator/GNAT superfamily N-acetyltransferase